MVLIPERNTSPWLILAIDLITIALGVLVAYLLRFNFDIPYHELVFLPPIMLYMMLVRGMAFLLFKTHLGIIRYTGTNDVIRLSGLLLGGTLVFVLTNIITYFINYRFYIPFSIIIIELLATSVVLIGYRIMVKVAYLEMVNPSPFTCVSIQAGILLSYNLADSKSTPVFSASLAILFRL